MAKTKKRILDRASVKFVQRVLKRNGDLEKLMKSPKREAKRVKLSLSSNVEKRLKQLRKTLSETGLEHNDKTTAEIVAFYNKVLIDGRYIKKWMNNPEGVAKSLKVKISKKSIDKLKSVNFKSLVDEDIFDDAAIWPVVIILIVLVLIPNCRYDVSKVIVDRSGKFKV